MNLINAIRDNDLHSRVFYNARYSEKGIENSDGDDVPTYDEHLKWYRKQNLDDMYLIYHKKYVGYVRIDMEGVISIAVCAGEYNKGYGTFALGEIVQKHSNLKAIVKRDNVNSIKLFKKFPEIELGFIDV